MPSAPQKGSGGSTASGLIEELRGGNRQAFDELYSLVYEELRGIARAQRRRLDGHATLNTTALVNEAYLRLGVPSEMDWESRAHMLSVAAKVMRQILIQDARAKSAKKRGGRRARVSLDDVTLRAPGFDPAGGHSDTLIALDESLSRLAEVNDSHHRIVECRFFGGMTIPDTAVALGLSRATVERGWAAARVWLYRDMRMGAENPA